MKAVFVRTKYRKNLLASSIFLLGIVTHYSNALPITDLPQHLQDLLPDNAGITGYQEIDVRYRGPYGTAGTISYFASGQTLNGHSGMPGALYVNGSSSTTDAVVLVVGDNVNVNTTAANADGLRSNGGSAANPGYIIVGNNLRVTTTGSSADAINAGNFGYSMNYAGSANIYVGDNAYLETFANSARGISASSVKDTEVNNVILGDHANIITHGDNSEGIRTGGINSTVSLGNSANIMTNGRFAYGIYTSKGITKLGQDARITTEGSSAHAVYAAFAGKITLGKDVIATANSGGTHSSTHTIYAYSSTASPNSTITFEEGATLYNGGSKATGSYAINAIGTGSKIDGSATGVYTIKGDLNATTGATIDLNMATYSEWVGASYLDATSTTNLTMANGVTWVMTDSSNITSLNSNGTVLFQPPAGGYHTLTTGSLSGNSIFSIKVDMAGQQGDLIDVTTNNVSGNHTLIIANNGATTTNGTEVLTVVKTLDNTQGSFTSNTVEVGAYEYNLRQKADGKEWELSATTQSTTTADASVNLLNTNYLLSYIDNQTLLQRMEQLRAVHGQQGDFWIRGFGGKLNALGNNSNGFDMSYKGTQIGIDKLINTNSGRLYLGTMVGFTDANPDYRGGHGTTKDYHFGLYSTYMADNGFYVDGVLKYTHLKNRFNVKDTLGATVTGKGSSEGYSASVEVGKRFYLSSSNKANGYFIEPQTQLTYGYQGGMTINGSNGLKTKLSNYNFVLGRASAVVGYTMNNANPIDIYIKTGYVREFDGKTSYQFNQGKKISHSAKGGWWENGVGINVQLNKKHNVYTDINYAKGNRFNHKQLNLGYRYSF